MKKTSTPRCRKANDMQSPEMSTSSKLSEYSEGENRPRMSTLRFLMQFARCYAPVPTALDGRVAGMVLN